MRTRIPVDFRPQPALWAAAVAVAVGASPVSAQELKLGPMELVAEASAFAGEIERLSGEARQLASAIEDAAAVRQVSGKRPQCRPHRSCRSRCSVPPAGGGARSGDGGTGSVDQVAG
ncbi:MAG: hypothetical protein HC888_14035 [Candidatus Competibacteraceae bacterium]|nr:hypothetical protein [Candidatus Competibacteraceae bacterium]